MEHSRKIVSVEAVYPMGFPLDRLLTEMVLVKGDCFIVHSSQDGQDLQNIRPGARCEKTVLPTYNAFRLQGLSRQEERRQLGLPMDENVILFFEFVREYKGLRHLLRAMPAIGGSVEKVRLLDAICPKSADHLTVYMAEVRSRLSGIIVYCLAPFYLATASFIKSSTFNPSFCR